MHGEVDGAFVDRVFTQHLLTLAEDSVPNIRFNVSKAMGGTYPHLSPANKDRMRESLEKMAATDTDFDSKYYAQKTLEAITGRPYVDQQ
mmetsp:Transcript_19609/g.26500  ORF Transcript_19609/g.26500 Transcript_19609/m.26500 type:complete len:89 (+) Transcript_19609:1646-1912(+)